MREMTERKFDQLTTNTIDWPDSLNEEYYGTLSDLYSPVLYLGRISLSVH